MDQDWGNCCASAIQIRKPGIKGHVDYCAVHSPSLPLMTGPIGPVDSNGHEEKRPRTVYLKDKECHLEGCSNQMEDVSWFEVSKGCSFACLCSVKCCKAFSQAEVNCCKLGFE